MSVRTPKARPGKPYTLLGPDRKPYLSHTPGRYGGYRPGKRYGRLDCPSALRAIARGGYVRHRVFFADEATAVAAGYRPCAVCLPGQHAAWRAAGGRPHEHHPAQHERLRGHARWPLRKQPSNDQGQRTKEPASPWQ